MEQNSFLLPMVPNTARFVHPGWPHFPVLPPLTPRECTCRLHREQRTKNGDARYRGRCAYRSRRPASTEQAQQLKNTSTRERWRPLLCVSPFQPQPPGTCFPSTCFRVFSSAALCARSKAQASALNARALQNALVIQVASLDIWSIEHIRCCPASWKEPHLYTLSTGELRRSPGELLPSIGGLTISTDVLGLP